MERLGQSALMRFWRQCCNMVHRVLKAPRCCARVESATLPPAGMVRLPSSLQHLSLSTIEGRVPTNGELMDLVQSLTHLTTLSLTGFKNAPGGLRMPASLRSVAVDASAVTLLCPGREQPRTGATLRMAAQSVNLGTKSCSCHAAPARNACNAHPACDDYGHVHLTFGHLDVTDCCDHRRRLDNRMGSRASTTVASVVSTFVAFLSSCSQPVSIELWPGSGYGSFTFASRSALTGILKSDRYATSAALLSALMAAGAEGRFDCAVVPGDEFSGVLLKSKAV